MIQIQYSKTFASKGSVSVFTKLRVVGFSCRLAQPLEKEANTSCANTFATSKLNKPRLCRKEGQKKFQLPPFFLAETWRYKGVAKLTLLSHPEKDTTWMHSLNGGHNDNSNVTQQNGFCQISLESFCVIIRTSNLLSSPFSRFCCSSMLQFEITLAPNQKQTVLESWREKKNKKSPQNPPKTKPNQPKPKQNKKNPHQKT